MEGGGTLFLLAMAAFAWWAWRSLTADPPPFDGWCRDCRVGVVDVLAHMCDVHPDDENFWCPGCGRQVQVEMWMTHRALFHDTKRPVGPDDYEGVK